MRSCRTQIVSLVYPNHRILITADVSAVTLSVTVVYITSAFAYYMGLRISSVISRLTSMCNKLEHRIFCYITKCL